MASIQARHSRTCPLYPWTPFDKATEGCTCPKGPLYHVTTWHERKLVREPVGHNRKTAERALRKTGVDVDEGSYQVQKNIRFRDWADEWQKNALRRPKENTRRSYNATLDYAKEAFGDKSVRTLGPTDMDRFLALMEKASDSTRAKHLRVLGACLQVALTRGYAARNPVRRLTAQERPRAAKREAAYFETEELPKLFAAIPEGLYRNVCQLALKTGMRQGELIALTWGDVDLQDATVQVRRTYTYGLGLSKPKTLQGERAVDLVNGLVDLLGAWWGECGKPGDDKLVFPGGGKDGYIVNSTLTRVILYPAMKTAGIKRVGPTGEKRTFHSFRHTFAKLAIENGAQLTWLQRHLGHSSLKVTADIYGHFGRAARKAETAKLEGVFSV